MFEVKVTRRAETGVNARDQKVDVRLVFHSLEQVREELEARGVRVAKQQLEKGAHQLHGELTVWGPLEPGVSRARCACSFYANATTGETTSCTATANRTFAPGHDAKLAGLLARTGARLQRALDLDTGRGVDPLDAAAEFSSKLVGKVYAAMERQRVKLDRARERATNARRLPGEDWLLIVDGHDLVAMPEHSAIEHATVEGEHQVGELRQHRAWWGGPDVDVFEYTDRRKGTQLTTRFELVR